MPPVEETDLRIGHVRTPAGNVDLMNAVVTDVAAAVLPEPVPGVVEVVFIERSRSGRSQPHVVVDARGGVAVRLPADARAQFAVHDPEEVHLAELAGTKVLDRRLDVRSAPILCADLHDTSVFPARRRPSSGFPRC